MVVGFVLIVAGIVVWRIRRAAQRRVEADTAYRAQLAAEDAQRRYAAQQQHVAWQAEQQRQAAWQAEQERQAAALAAAADQQRREAVRQHWVAEAERERAANEERARLQQAAKERSDEFEVQRRAYEAEAAQRRERERAEAQERAARRAETLVERFGEVSAKRIMNQEFWVGQTRDELLEARGRPADIDVKVLKTKTKEVFKYNEIGSNRYALRITLDNGVVVGWEDKR